MNKSLINKRKLNSSISLYYFRVVVSYVYYSYKNGYEIHVVNLSYLEFFILDSKSTLSLRPKRVGLFWFTKLFDPFCSVLTIMANHRRLCEQKSFPIGFIHIIAQARKKYGLFRGLFRFLRSCSLNVLEFFPTESNDNLFYSRNYEVQSLRQEFSYWVSEIAI